MYDFSHIEKDSHSHEKEEEVVSTKAGKIDWNELIFEEEEEAVGAEEEVVEEDKEKKN